MRRTVLRFLTPGWVGFTLIAWAAAITMVLLGRWQLRVSDSKHFDLQNFGYSLQWWAFSLFAVGLWAKSILDTVRGRTAGAPVGGEVVLQGRTDGVVPVGPAELMTRPEEVGVAPVRYRGYLMPQSSTSPARSDGDRVREEYNDYLWQLALADSATPPVRAGSAPAGPSPADHAPPDPSPVEPSPVEPSPVEPSPVEPSPPASGPDRSNLELPGSAANL